MNIEISPKEYWRQMNYHDGMIYCSMVVIEGKTDWRMITDEEAEYFDDRLETMSGGYVEYCMVWFNGDDSVYNKGQLEDDMFVIPVRDIEKCA